jgi:hypothetical protein
MLTAPSLTCRVLAFTLLAASASAQTPPVSTTAGPAPVSRWQAGIGVVGAAPVGDFSSNIDAAGGVAGHLDARLGPSPLRLGGEVGYLLYGDQTRTVALASLIPEIPDASVKVNTSNAMFLLHARLRAQRHTGRWRPYGDAVIGLTDLFTTSSIPGPIACVSAGGGGGCTTTEVAGTTNARDVVLSYGAGAGVLVAFGRSRLRPQLDLSLRYLAGGAARYLTEGALRIEHNRVVLDFSESRTDMVAFYIGVMIGG